MNHLPRRRAVLAALAAVPALLTACATNPTPPMPTIVFVHGNGDSAALWMTTIWRFESQGWPRDKLVAVDLPNPLARDDDAVAQPGRSSAAENAQALAAEVDRALARTGDAKVVLVGNSRGGNAIRHYVQYLGGAAKVSHVVIGGTPSHGVWADAASRPNAEFNGAGPYLTGLNAPKGAGGDEVTPGVRWLTLRSDNNDKYAQADGVWIGQRGVATHVTAEGPALKGATNLVLPARDHREVSFHPDAFVRTYAFVTGREPAGSAVVAEPRPVLDGVVSGGNPYDNRPLAGARVEVWEVDPATGARRGAAPLHAKTTAADGRWGPFAASPTARYEFAVTAPGAPTAHVYRSEFPRGSDVVQFRVERPLADADRAAGSVVVWTRPRGYFGLPRDTLAFDGAPPPGVPTGVAGVSSSRLRLPAGEPRTVIASFASGAIDERIAARTWPAAQNEVAVVEMTY